MTVRILVSPILSKRNDLLLPQTKSFHWQRENTEMYILRTPPWQTTPMKFHTRQPKQYSDRFPLLRTTCVSRQTKAINFLSPPLLNALRPHCPPPPHKRKKGKKKKKKKVSKRSKGRERKKQIVRENCDDPHLTAVPREKQWSPCRWLAALLAGVILPAINPFPGLFRTRGILGN